MNSQPSAEPLPAITEESATGEIARLYADIRQTLGVPVVNLVWRHLATFPGALAWTWERVKPLYISGRIAAEAEALYGELALPDLPKWPPEALTAAGLSAGDLGRIRTVLASYNRSNGMNLVALGALLAGFEGGLAPAPAQLAVGSASAVEGELPKLLTLTEMKPATAALVLRLNELGERGDGRIIASMYRHLAHWPPFLALAWTLVAPLEADGRLRPTIDAGLRLGRSRAAALVGGLARAQRPLDDQTADRTREAIETFTTHPIAKMMIHCALIHRATPPHSAWS